MEERRSILIVVCLLIVLTVLVIAITMPPVNPPSQTMKTLNVIATGDTNGEVILWAFENGTYIKFANYSFLEGTFNELCYIQNIEIGDVTDDGSDELVITLNGRAEGERDFNSMVVVCSLNKGEITAIWNNTFQFDWTAMALSIGDADNDGKNDNFIASCSSQMLVYKYQSGGFEIINTVPIEDYLINVLRIGDTDNDKLNEVLVTENNKAEVWKVVNNTINNVGFLSDESRLDNIRVDDLDGDGKNEVITCGCFGHISIFKRNSSAYGGYLEVWHSQITGSCDNMVGIYQDCAVGDINNDGKKEIVGFMIRDLNETGRTLAWQWNGSDFIKVLDFAHEGFISGMYQGNVGDCDGDGVNEWSVDVGGSKIIVYRDINGSTSKLWEYEDPNFHSSNAIHSEIGLIHYLE